ncbi:probable mediator of RNA polymerase II transcription subunit 26b isoform X2 [Chenopodium quinoa]|uniref:probable mediator of RNA polymerase II transcription subunit 26b isoform X2 n=1 Tax=Chenopodium quinoa TaxID=63459 RepID=UPI000B79990A|nr:probable mediator of RNA polymerase II transcription subunit 26b isoform X2 [Chenopodium quinoa]
MTSKPGGHKTNNNAGGGGIGVGLDNWRDYFRRANSDIFDIIEHAIMVAASDCPKEFRVRRERIAELLFTCRLTRCLGCDRVELAVSEVDEGGCDGDVKVVIKSVNDGFNVDDDVNGGGGSKGSKVNSTTRENEYDQNDIDQHIANLDLDMILNHESNYSFDDAEALTNEIEEAREVVDEVLRIKEILLNSQDQSDSVLFESLRRLQLMQLDVDILKTTEIGKAVNRIRRHNAKNIRHLARALIDGWKIIVDEWVKASQELGEGGTPDSVNPSTVDEEEGLPSPPLEEGVFFSTQHMDFNQNHDDDDERGNVVSDPRKGGEFNRNLEAREAGRKPSVAEQDPPKRREEPKQVTPLPKDNMVQQTKRQEPLSKPNKPISVQSGPGRPVKPNGEQNINKDSRVQQKPVIQRRPPPQPEMRPSSDNDVQEKLEATKRKLQERYQQAENAKRQRTIQVMEIHDIPKQGLTKPNAFGKFGNNRHWANGRK